MATHRLVRWASRAWPLLALVAVLASAAIVSAAVSDGEPAFDARGPRAEQGTFVPGDATPQRVRELRVGGHVRGLYPGARKRFRARVRNPGDHGLIVSSIRTEVGDAGPGCGADNVRVPERSRDTTVPGHSTVRVPLRAVMRGAAADACQNARFPLAFKITARAAP